VIAEIGINHEGSFEKAVRMVEEASRAGWRKRESNPLALKFC